MSDLEFGLRTTIVGMGIVVGLLAAMWALLALALRLDGRRDTVEEAAAPAATERRVEIEGAAALDPILVAAITVAVLRHAEARRLQAAPAMRSYWPGSLLFASRWVAAGRARQAHSWRRRSR